MRKITSAANPLIKVFRQSLAAGVTRDGWLAVEGPLLLREAIAVSTGHGEKRRAAPACAVRSVLVARSASARFPEILAQLPSDAEVAEVPDDIFHRVAATVTPQGMAALVEVAQPEMDSILQSDGAVIVAAFGLQDPGNLGTILRSADAFGADALATLKPAVSPHNPKILRASGGALFRLPVYASLDAETFFSRLVRAGVRLIAADPRGNRGVAESDLRGRVAFLIGNEAAGLPLNLPMAERVSIPLRPGMDSLNAAVAAGVILYECARQRKFHYY